MQLIEPIHVAAAYWVEYILLVIGHSISPLSRIVKLCVILVSKFDRKDYEHIASVIPTQV